MTLSPHRHEIEGPARLLGLVRAVDHKAGRHAYGIGARPPGEAPSDLGALLADPEDGAIPVWSTPDGRIVSEGHDAAPPSAVSLLAALRWALAPIGWPPVGDARARARALARRVLLLAALPRRGADSSPERSAAPAGWLHAEGGLARRPLFSAVHPVTGDQLLTTYESEAALLGYGAPTRLGYLVAAAPVTGVLGERSPKVPWARHLGQERPKEGDPMALGAIADLPSAEPVAREAFRVRGWALLLPGTVSRVEVLIDGRKVGCARLGLPPRPGVHSLARDHPAAPISGFQWRPTPADLPPDADRVRVELLVTGIDGTAFFLTVAGEVSLTAGDPTPEGEAGAASPIRADTAAPVRSRRRAAADRLRLLAVGHRLDQGGGSQRYFYEQVRRLVRDFSVDCTVVAPGDDYWRGPLEETGAHVHLTPGYPASSQAAYESAVSQLAAWIAAREFDAVFVNSLGSFMGSDAAQRLGLPVVWSLHESVDLRTWLGGHGARIHPHVGRRVHEALAGAAGLVFVAEATKRLFEPYGDPARMRTLPIGLELGDIDDFRRDVGPTGARRALGVPDDAVLLLCLGTLTPRKLQAPLAQAFAAVADEHPEARLALVGDRGGDYSAGLRDFIARAGLGERCSIVPATPDAYSWHASADLFVLASDEESSPITILEALAFDTPVLASSVFGVPELIEDGRHGYLCEPNDVGDLARSLERVLAIDPRERERVARAGAERVRERHDPDRYAGALYEMLLDASLTRSLNP